MPETTATSSGSPAGSGSRKTGFWSKKIGPVPVWLIALVIVALIWWYEKYGPGATSSASTSSGSAGNASGSSGPPVYVEITQGATGTGGSTGTGAWHYPAPRDLAAHPGRTSVKLSWQSPPEQDAEPRPLSYEVRIEGGETKTVPVADPGSGGGQHSTTMGGLKEGRPYTATVRANGGGGAGNASPATVTFTTTGKRAAVAQDEKGHTAAEKASDETSEDTAATTPTGAQDPGRWRTPYQPAAPASPRAMPAGNGPAHPARTAGRRPVRSEAR